MACASNEVNHSAMLWDLSNGEQLQEMRRTATQLPYLDFAHVRHNETSVLAGMADSRLEVYRWESAGR